jgi:hypothetical protein
MEPTARPFYAAQLTVERKAVDAADRLSLYAAEITAI